MKTLARLCTLTAILALFCASPAAAQNLQLFETGTFQKQNATKYEEFGWAMAMQNNRLAIGALNDTVANHAGAGRVYLQERQDNGTWSQTLLESDSPQGAAAFGASVAFDGNALFVGAPWESTAQGVQTGAVYIYEKNVNGTWNLVTKLQSPDPQYQSAFGWTLSASNDVLAVGSIWHNTLFTPKSGAVFLFKKLQGHWIFFSKLSASDSQFEDRFGTSLSLQNNRLLVGANTAIENSIRGGCYVFEDIGNSTWLQKAKIVPNDKTVVDAFATTLSLDGDVAAIGSPYHHGSNGALYSGAIYIYERNAQDIWQQKTLIEESTPITNGTFGSSVALQSTRLLTGALHGMSFDGTPGAAYLYTKNAANQWMQSLKMDPINAHQDNMFGSCVVLDGDRIAISNARTDGSKNIPESVQLYRLCNECTVEYGNGTPGCNGTQVLGVTSAPEIGSADFALTCTAVPAFSLGLALITNAPDATGTDSLGIGALLLVDLFNSTEVIALDFYSSDFGLGIAPAPIPNDTNLIGNTYYAAALWAWATCPLPPLGLSSSRGLAITILNK